MFSSLLPFILLCIHPLDTVHFFLIYLFSETEGREEGGREGEEEGEGERERGGKEREYKDKYESDRILRL